MNVELTELQDNARKVLSDLGIAADEQQLWVQIVELGWLMVAAPETAGGLGMGLSAANIFHEEMGRALGTAPFLPALLALDAVERGRPDNREQLLMNLMSGELRVTAALGESELCKQAKADGSLQLSGTVPAVLSADSASHALLQTKNADCIALIDLQQQGVEYSARPTWDSTRRLFDLQLRDARVDPAALVASGPTAQTLCLRQAIVRDFALASDAVGGASALLDRTVEYLGLRQQFGRPLAMFQALKHRCADLKALVSAAEALLADGLARSGELSNDSALLADADSMARAAKQLACTAYLTMAEEALQLHGGIGMTAEHDCHLFLKRAMLNEHLGRAAEAYDVSIADQLLAEVASA
ncbi:MAG: acyl-CoA dehydrogenase family protein [Pseudomonadales bacterium]